MATETEERVLRLLSATEVPANAAEQIAQMGPEAVNVACEAALGTYVGLRLKVRTNAASVVGRLTDDQARQTLALLVTDPSDDVAIRALRAVRRRTGEEDLLARAALVLGRADASPLVVVEAIDALAASPDVPLARDALTNYREAGEGAPPHRSNQLVQQALDQQ
jgi:HEAT repeat protein